MDAAQREDMTAKLVTYITEEQWVILRLLRVAVRSPEVTRTAECTRICLWLNKRIAPAALAYAARLLSDEQQKEQALANKDREDREFLVRRLGLSRDQVDAIYPALRNQLLDLFASERRAS